MTATASLTTDKIEILKELHKLGVTHVEISYSGSGDDGMLEDIEAFKNRKKIAMPEEVSEKVEEFAYDALNHHFGGWEINEGSRGNMRIDVATKKVTIDHEHYIMQTEEESVDF